MQRSFHELGYHARMVSARISIVVFAVFALLFARMVGTHLHLCFDQTEPHTSIQGQMNDIADDLDHDEWSSHTSKQDIDIDLVGQALAKITQFKLDLPFFLAIAVLLILLPRTLVPRRANPLQILVTAARSYIRPPLRAPPR